MNELTENHEDKMVEMAVETYNGPHFFEIQGNLNSKMLRYKIEITCSVCGHIEESRFISSPKANFLFEALSPGWMYNLNGYEAVCKDCFKVMASASRDQYHG